MCYHTKLTTTATAIEKEFDATFYETDLYQPKEAINGFSFALNPVVLDEDSGHITLTNWGLIPFWALRQAQDKLKPKCSGQTAQGDNGNRKMVCASIALRRSSY